MFRSQETTEVRDAHRFDERALVGYLSETIAGFSPPVTIRQFEGGQSNPTFLVSTGSGDYVLRKKPPGPLLPTAHMVEREYRVMGALRESGVPVPRTVLCCEDEAVIGTTFFVMEFVRGRVFWDPTLPDMAANEKRAVYREMNRVLAALHRTSPEAVGLSDFGRPGNYFARQIRRWTSQYESAATEKNEAMEKLIEWLPANVPQDDSTAIVHGDFRLDNMIFHPTEPKILAVLDWELSTLGHPLADLSYNCLPYHFSRFGAKRLSEAVLDERSGLPTEREYVAWYCERTSRDSIAEWRFYLAFSLFRLASITQGVYKRSLQGNASSSRASESIATARATSAEGWRIVAEG